MTDKRDPMRKISGNSEKNTEVEVNLSDIITVLNDRMFYLESKVAALEKKVIELEERSE